MTTIATIFSGGEGVGVGARMAGVNHLWGIEYDDKIAQVARNNHFDTITADVLDIDPSTLQMPDILHASPVCTRASVANSDGEECQLDIDTARKTAEFITVLRPKYFTLENVYPYREFESFKIICDALARNGYSFDYWHLNSADYGVPQTRRRLILIARLDGGQNWIPKPIPTHHNPKDFDDNQMALFAPTTKPWVGWYSACLNELAIATPTKWQRSHIKNNGTVLNGVPTAIETQNAIRKPSTRKSHEPLWTLGVSFLSRKSHHIIWNNGEWFRFTRRGFGIIGGFPAWYKFPQDTIFYTVLGNAVPPLLYSRIVESLIKS